VTIRFNRIILPVVVMALAALGTAVALGAENTSNTPTEHARVSAVDEQQAATFGILRRGQHPGDGVNTAAPGPFGANVELARSTDTPAGKVWVVPADQRICLRVEDSVGPAWTCVPTDQAEQGRLMLSLRSPDGSTPVSVYGLLPDGEQGAKIAAADGTSRDLPVSDNVFGARLTDVSKTSFVDGDGKRHTIAVP
jgi:hypothetical protein